MDTIEKRKKDLILLLFIFNVLFLIVSFIINIKPLGILIYMNILFLGTWLILNKYYYLFDSLKQTNKFAKVLNNKLEGIRNG